eukprot:CAMPEP_0203642302 /NCGR_PEP_ID=MMETSP0088-20131115/7670_1 /ASSEMBLY_ACC=CAM_ASM_001087 /TAXON_ID=426623 /ORGANISM="Chaetoceros affinis, Strain CCMP159" /LENGTH=35 /DNA_ID= /DNA_START= /DNA_END= /DNA_ORIENTATION=
MAQNFALNLGSKMPLCLAASFALNLGSKMPLCLAS